eukprot:1157686-Pelagomonas_calceolata.AAC.4
MQVTSPCCVYPPTCTLFPHRPPPLAAPNPQTAPNFHTGHLPTLRLIQALSLRRHPVQGADVSGLGITVGSHMMTNMAAGQCEGTRAAVLSCFFQQRYYSGLTHDVTNMAAGHVAAAIQAAAAHHCCMLVTAPHTTVGLHFKAKWSGAAEGARKSMLLLSLASPLSLALLPLWCMTTFWHMTRDLSMLIP